MKKPITLLSLSGPTKALALLALVGSLAAGADGATNARDAPATAHLVFSSDRDGGFDVYAADVTGRQRSTKSCLWYRGKIKWCLRGWEGDEWSISQYAGRAHIGRYYVHNHKDEVLGYLRPAGRPGTWRAMVSVCFAGPRPCGWARGGKVVRASRNAYHVYQKGKRVGIARGPAAIAVAAFKLVIGDCSAFC